MVTLMRSSPEEMRAVGKFICDKLLKTKKPEMVQVWIPKGGVSMIAVPDGPFADEEADKCLFEEIGSGLEGSGIRVVEKEEHVNDEGFARDIAEALVALLPS